MNPIGRVVRTSVLSTAVRVALALAALLAVSPSLAWGAAPVTWLVPAGGETWTAGTTHTIEWSGGDPTVFQVAYVQQFSPFAQTVIPGLVSFPNNGHGSWVLSTDPSLLLPGTYRLAIGIQGDPNGPYYSNAFTVRAGTECSVQCQRVTASFPVPSPFYSSLPVAQCDVNASSAVVLAQTYIQTQLASQCAVGYFLDPSSVVIDVTVLPVATCLFQGSGLVFAEASGFGCCCPEVVPARRATWGTIKAVYR